MQIPFPTPALSGQVRWVSICFSAQTGHPNGLAKGINTRFKVQAVLTWLLRVLWRALNKRSPLLISLS